MRIDTTVVEAPIRYPTDSGLLEDAVREVDSVPLGKYEQQAPHELRHARQRRA